VWHVPGDTDLSGDDTGDDYSERMPARLAPLDSFSIDIEHVGASQDLVVAEERIRGSRLGRVLDVRCGHVFRLDQDSRIVEGWGWCDDQAALDAFFAYAQLALSRGSPKRRNCGVESVAIARAT